MTGIATGIAQMRRRGAEHETPVSAASGRLRRCRAGSCPAALLLGCAVVALSGCLTVLSNPAQAQVLGFVCGGSATGAEPQAGAGASAGPNAVACGTTATAGGANSSAFGSGSTAAGIDSTAVGSGSTASTDQDSAFGTRSTASGGGSTAIGFLSSATGQGGTAVGSSSAAGDAGSAFGNGSKASGVASTAVGVVSEASGRSSVAFGNSTVASGTESIAIGVSSDAVGTSSTAIGERAQALADGSTAIGPKAQATGPSAIAIGDGAVASGSVAIGKSALASGGGTALGDLTVATGANATAVGTGANAAPDGSAAFGAGATATRPNQQVFGTASNTYTTPGITSAASKAAQGAPTHFVMSNPSGDLAAYTPTELGLATSNDFSALQSQINALARRDREHEEGIAIAMAMHDPDLVAGEKLGLKLSWGNFEGSNAIALTAAGVLGWSVFTPGDRLAVSGGLGVGTDQGQVGGRVGVQLTWK
jgi:hypothetical protein